MPIVVAGAPPRRQAAFKGRARGPFAVDSWTVDFLLQLLEDARVSPLARRVLHDAFLERLPDYVATIARAERYADRLGEVQLVFVFPRRLVHLLKIAETSPQVRAAPDRPIFRVVSAVERRSYATLTREELANARNVGMPRMRLQRYVASVKPHQTDAPAADR